MFGRRRSGFGAQSPVPDTDAYPDLTDYEEKFIRPTEPAPTFAPVQENVSQSFIGTEVMQSTPISTERPMVFVSKAHSGIYIYEYSDRLEYYVKTSTCMHKFDTVKKQTNG